MSLIDKILSKLRDDDKSIKLKIQPQESDWVTIQFHINYEQRCDLIDSIETKAEIPVKFLIAFAEAIRNKELNKDRWRKEEAEYYDRMSRLMLKYDLKN